MSEFITQGERTKNGTKLQFEKVEIKADHPFLARIEQQELALRLEWLDSHTNPLGYSLNLSENLEQFREKQWEELKEHYDDFASSMKGLPEIDFSCSTKVEEYLPTLVDPTALTKLFCLIGEEELEFFLEVVHGVEELSVSRLGRIKDSVERGLLFLYEEEGSFFLYVSQEVQTALESLDMEAIKKVHQRRETIYNMTVTAINLYGAISFEELLTIFTKYYPEECLTVEELECVVINYKERVHYLSFVEDGYVSAAFYCEFPDELEELLRLQEGKPCYIPEKLESFLCYRKEWYEPSTIEFKKATAFFETMDNDKESLESLFGSLQFDFKTNCDLETILRSVEYEGFVPRSEKKMRELIEVLMELDHHARKWCHKGHTAWELVTYFKGEFLVTPLERAPVEKKTVTPSKNGPCPCGSGKKFKRCCGK